MRRLLLALALAAGCACPTSYEIAERWRPLARLEQDTSVPPGLFRTRLGTVRTADICAFTHASAVDQAGLLTHERVHALRQGDAQGLAYYEARFAVDPAFRWQEEAVAYEAQLRFVLANGGSVDAPYLAHVMATSYGSMVTEDAALAWVEGVVRSAR